MSPWCAVGASIPSPTHMPKMTEIQQKSTKPYKQTKALEHLLAQGTWTTTEFNGHTVPYLAMPTPELQAELSAALEKNIKKHLKDGGYEYVRANRRDHPLHSELLRERIDCLAERYGGREFRNPEAIAAVRKDLQKYNREERKLPPGPVPLKWRLLDIDHEIADGIKQWHASWPKAFALYRAMRRDPWYWRGSEVYTSTFCPPDGPPLPDGPPPKPVYMKPNHDVVLALEDGFVHLWVRVPH